MISFKCKNCAGEMSVDRQGMLFCEYCGSKEVFTDKDLQQYREFRFQMLNYLRGLNDQKKDGAGELDRLWHTADMVQYKSADGTDINISYIYASDVKEATCYVARRSVIYVFTKEQARNARLLERGLSMVSFPAADMKGLDRSFPSVSGKYELENGGVMLILSRRENVFPLGMFGALEPEHAAWIVSRLENICCVLEYSGIVHGGISQESVFIDPFLHEAVLYGGWWNATEKTNAPLVNPDLAAVRKTAGYIIGIHRDKMPKEFAAFISELPGRDAYTDFEHWDRVIEKGFGGRRFVKMDME